MRLTITRTPISKLSQLLAVVPNGVHILLNTIGHANVVPSEVSLKLISLGLKFFVIIATGCESKEAGICILPLAS